MFGRITPMVRNILLINFAIYFLSFYLPLNEIFSLKVVFSENFAIYQPFTYMWLHSQYGLMHILGNMFGVFIFGPMLEAVWGSRRFLIFYLLCGVGSGVLFGAADYFEKKPLKNRYEAYMADPNPDDYEIFVRNHLRGQALYQADQFAELYYNNPNSENLEQQSIYSRNFGVKTIYDAYVTFGQMVGASGALFGLLFAFAYLFPNTQLFLLFPPIPIKAKYLVLFYGLYELYSEVNRSPGDNVAHLAHLGGMLVAFILLNIWRKNKSSLY